MSPSPNTLPKFIHVTAVAVSLERALWSKRLNSGELRIGPHRHTLMCDNGKLYRKFQNVAVELTPDTRIILHYKTSLFSRQKKVQIDTDQLFASFSASQAQDFELSVSHDGIRIVFSCRTAHTVRSIPEYTGIVSSTTRADEALTPSTDAIFKGLPRFRILVIGKSGVGKSSLIHTAFGIDNAYSSDFVRGEADIEKGLESVVNERLILHDSLGFEAADNVNYDTVKQFIRRRQSCPPEDRLHAVWFCVPVPRTGGRLLEAAAEDFFRTEREIMGTIPVIVVYTKIDMFVDERTMKLAASRQQLDEDRLRELAFSEAKSSMEEIHKKINRFAGESLPYAVVSTKPKYKYTLQQLIKLTSDRVEAHNTPEAQISPGLVTLIAAQRIDPNLKIKGTISVGKQKYWKSLGSSHAFKERSILDCLSVIHTDIVAIWNFNDPACHLSEKEFKDLVIGMAEKMEIRPVSNPAQKTLALSGGSLVTVISAILGSVANPAAPIVMPIIAGVAIAVWLYGVYRNAKIVQQLFIAYIIDLTHILETLAILTARDHKKLTRRIIKLAYCTYRDSGLMTQAHSSIQKFRELGSRDAALEMIENSIKPERYGDASLRNYYAGISKLDLGKFRLDQEEEW